MSDAPTFCTEMNRTEPLAGTAPIATAWLIVEAAAAWSRLPLADGVLGPAGTELVVIAEGTGTRLQVARRANRRATGTQFWLAANNIVRTATYEDPRELLDLDFNEIGAGRLPEIGRLSTEPLLFICQNGKRDACCARLGRPLVNTLTAEFPDQVWETSHLGGHRFAPTALLLPDGTVHGRLDEPAARTLLTEAALGRTSLPHCRGRAELPRALQAAELAVRTSFDINGITDLTVTAQADGGLVRHIDGRAWHVHVDEVHIAPRPESCGGADVAGTTFRAGTPTLV